LDNLRECRDSISFSLGKGIGWERLGAGDDKKPLARMWISEVMGRDQSVTTTPDVLGTSHLIADLLEGFAHDFPRATVIVALEISDVFEKQVPRSSLFYDGDNLMEQSSPRFVLQTFLIARFREWLARKSGT
jgi:hypothetical protein